MPSTKTPADSMGVTTRELEIKWTVSGSQMEYFHVVPEGTRCAGLLGGDGSLRWVVDDLSWMPKSDFAHFDADHHGIDVPEDAIDVTVSPAPPGPGMR